MKQLVLLNVNLSGLYKEDKHILEKSITNSMYLFIELKWTFQE